MLWHFCQLNYESIDNVPLFCWAKLNQTNEVAPQNVSKGLWVVSRASFLGCQRPSQHPAVASPQQIDKMPSDKPRFEPAMGNVPRICDLSNLCVANFIIMCKLILNCRSSTSGILHPSQKRSLAKRRKLKGPRASPALQPGPYNPHNS